MDDAGHLNLVAGIAVATPAALGGLALAGLGDGNDGGKIANFLGVLVEWMAGDEETQHLLFVGKAIALFPVRNVRKVVFTRAVHGRFVKKSKQPGLTQLLVLLRFL